MRFVVVLASLLCGLSPSQAGLVSTLGTLATCNSISKSTSSASQVYYALSTNYITDNLHYFLSSAQVSTCVVEVGSTADTSQVIKIIGQTKTPFAVVSGGHSSNQGFSSTQGVLISLHRLKNFTRSADNSYALVGTGNTWVDDVYPQLDGTGYGIVGGRVEGPGVGGFTLGGGFSWITNQYGLTVDNVQSYTLVLPNGTITEVDSSQPDLFFALRGGLNRFGIVTQVKMKLVSLSSQVWGGYQIYNTPSIPALINATQTFQATNKDPKAQVILTLSTLAGVETAILIQFYAGPTPGPSLAPFSQIGPATINQVKTQSFLSFAKSTPSRAAADERGAFHTFSTTGYTLKFMQAVRNETLFYGALAAAHSGVFISYDIEPFLSSYGQYATDSAWPHAKSPLPLNLDFSWLDPADDDYWRANMQQSANTLIAVAKSEGIYSPDLYAYPNYALSTYTGDQLYGPTNAARLRTIKAAVDPNGVMDLTGGFKL